LEGQLAFLRLSLENFLMPEQNREMSDLLLPVGEFSEVRVDEEPKRMSAGCKW